MWREVYPWDFLPVGSGSEGGWRLRYQAVGAKHAGLYTAAILVISPLKMRTVMYYLFIMIV